MKNNIIFMTLLCCFMSVFALSTFAETETETETDSLITGAPNIFIDCSYCDFDYLRRDIRFVNFVRDRKQSDVHILVSRQDNGGGGEEYTIEFIGLNDFDKMVDTLRVSTLESDTDNMIREKISHTFKLGLMRFVSKTNLSEDITIGYSKPTKVKEEIDKWKNWVFSTEVNGNLNGQESYRFVNLWGNLSARRTTKEMKTYIGVWGNYNEQKFTFDEVSSLYISRGKGFESNLILSIDDHWSYAFFSNFYTSTYSNKRFGFSFSPGIEYNIYPYEESSRRQLRIRYMLSSTYHDYEEMTVFFKTNDWWISHSLRATLDLIQPWGSIGTTLSASNYLKDFDLNNLSLRSNLSIRVIEGLSFNLQGSVSRTHDQISLRLSDVSIEDVMARNIELGTEYNYWLNGGFSFSFGSIYNNIVNPRFGG